MEYVGSRAVSGGGRLCRSAGEGSRNRGHELRHLARVLLGGVYPVSMLRRSISDLRKSKGHDQQDSVQAYHLGLGFRVQGLRFTGQMSQRIA